MGVSDLRGGGFVVGAAGELRLTCLVLRITPRTEKVGTDGTHGSKQGPRK